MVSSITHLFADDCLMYHTIASKEDAAALQEDLDQLQKWEQDWQMKFNTGKCEVICITNKRKVINRAYKIHGQTVQNTKKAKYLGVTIDSSLTWNAHVDAIAKRSISTILLTKKPTILPKGCNFQHFILLARYLKNYLS